MKHYVVVIEGVDMLPRVHLFSNLNAAQKCVTAILKRDKKENPNNYDEDNGFICDVDDFGFNNYQEGFENDTWYSARIYPVMEKDK